MTVFVELFGRKQTGTQKLRYSFIYLRCADSPPPPFDTRDELPHYCSHGGGRCPCEGLALDLELPFLPTGAQGITAKKKKPTRRRARLSPIVRRSQSVPQHNTAPTATQHDRMHHKRKNRFSPARVFFIRILESTRKKGFLHASSSPSARPTRPNVASRRVRFSDRDAR